MKRVLTYGTFDLLHYGHIEILRRAKALGDYLVVALGFESETFGIEKAIEAGYNELYVQSKDVIDKKMEAINKKIAEEAFEKAKTAINEARSKKEQELIERESNIDELIKELAKGIIKNNENALGTDITERSIKEIEEEGGETNEKKQKATRTNK